MSASAGDTLTVTPAGAATDDVIGRRSGADVRHPPPDRLHAGQIADGDRRDVQVARIERIAGGHSALQVAGLTPFVVPHRNASQSLTSES